MKILSIIIITLIIVSSSLDVEAKNIQIDSLQTILNNSKSAKGKALIIKEIAVKYTEINVDSAILYYNQLLKISKQNNLVTFEANALNKIGTLYENKKLSIDSILFYFDKALSIAEKINDNMLKIDIINNIGLTYYNHAEYDKALEQLYKASKLAKASQEYKENLRAYKLIGAVFFAKGAYLKALEYFKKGLIESQQYKESELQANFLNNIGAVYFSLNKIDSALVYFKECTEILEANNQNRDLSLTLLNIARIQGKKGNYELSYQYIEKAINIAMDINYGNGLIGAYNLLSNLGLDQKKYQETIEYAKKGLKLASNLDRSLDRLRFLELLKKGYVELKDFEIALKISDQYEMLEDSIFKLDKEKQIQELNTKYEVEQKEADNKLLKAEAEMAKKQTRNRTFTIIGLGIILLLIIGWSSFIYKANQEKKKINEILEIKVQERTKELEQANYELRTFNYIASHDIKEPIRVIGGYAGFIFRKLPNDLKESLGEYFDTIKRSTAQLYTIIEDFANYTTMSKSEKIEKQSVDLNLLATNIVVNLQESIKKYKGKVIIQDLPTIKSSNSLLFTTLKNLVENGLKYNKSETPTVNIDYQKTANTHQIIVSDNGIGIDKIYHEKIFEMFKRLHNRGEYEGSGIGLAIVKLSVQKLDGNIELESEEGKGSRFVIKLPI